MDGVENSTVLGDSKSGISNLKRISRKNEAIN